MAEENNRHNDTNEEVIDLRLVIRELFHHKLLFLLVWIVVGAASAYFIVQEPRTYTTSLTLAPELATENAGGAISSLASSFGINLGGTGGNDAFYPELYPDVMSTNEFIVNLLYTPIKTQDGKVNTSYLEYIIKHKEKNQLLVPIKNYERKIKEYFEKPGPAVKVEKKLDPLNLTLKEDQMVQAVRNSVKCDVDIKTNVITITVSEQDPLVCVILADTCRARLQNFITEYRTSKSRKDMNYYKKLMDDAEKDYNKVVKKYADYCDSHQDIILQSYISERDNMENDMQAKLTTYNAMSAQYEAAKAKVQERTPAFTLLQAAAMPVKPTGPKRMIFVAAMLFLASILTVFFIFRKSIGNQLLGPELPREEKKKKKKKVVAAAETEEDNPEPQPLGSDGDNEDLGVDDDLIVIEPDKEDKKEEDDNLRFAPKTEE